MIKKITINFIRFKASLLSNTHLTLCILILMLLRPILNLVDFFASSFMSNQKKSSHKFILICAPPRSGSTFIYQVVSQVLNSIYFSNLHQLFPRLASKMFFKNINNTNLKIYRNYYGYTKELRGVNEGNSLINYWFRTQDRSGIRRRFIESMNWLGNKKKSHIIIKNVGIYDRLFDLYQAVPEIIIVNVSRNPQQLIESTLKAFYELGYFNPIPKNMQNRSFDNPSKFAVDQFINISKILDNQLKKIPNKNIVNLSYEEFCKNPKFYIEIISKKFKIVPNLTLLDDITIRASQSQKISDIDSQKIKTYLSKIKKGTKVIN